MAGDWIKMRTDLYRDPKVILIADLLMAVDGELGRYVNQNLQRDMTVTRNVMRNVTVGALVSVWGVMRHRGKRHDDHLVIPGCTISVVDDVADLPGFGAAMLAVGWLFEVDDGLKLPNFFEEFNVDPNEDSKAKNAERQRRHREKRKLRNVTVTSQSNTEKRREEKIDTSNDVSRTGTKFVKPTVDEVKTYCVSRGNQIDPETFINYYESNGWRVGKNPMKDWRASIRHWEKNGYDNKTSAAGREQDRIDRNLDVLTRFAAGGIRPGDGPPRRLEADG